jgi:hypothetical protein
LLLLENGVVVRRWKRLEFDERMFPPESRSVVNRLVSDHRPISVIIRPAEEDDDEVEPKVEGRDQ